MTNYYICSSLKQHPYSLTVLEVKSPGGLSWALCSSYQRLISGCRLGWVLIRRLLVNVCFQALSWKGCGSRTEAPDSSLAVSSQFLEAACVPCHRAPPSSGQQRCMCWVILTHWVSLTSSCATSQRKLLAGLTWLGQGYQIIFLWEGQLCHKT